jgi:pimeloyl-ACP methyl ester carboxylesterase
VIDPAMIELLAQTGVKRATLLGYCLGGIFATLYAATHPANVENLVTLATPVDLFRAGPVYRYVRTLDVDGLVDRLGNVPGEWIRDQVWALTTMTMPARNLRIWRELLSCSWDPSYLERQRLVSRWLNDLVPLPGEAYRQFVKDLVQANKLVRGEFLIDGNAVDARRSPAWSSSWPTLAMSLHLPSRPRPCLRWSRAPIAKPGRFREERSAMWTSWSDLRGRASCGRRWLHGWRPAQERTGRKPSGAGRPQAPRPAAPGAGKRWRPPGDGC